MGFNKKGIGGLWVKEKTKNKNGRVVKTRYLSMKITVGERSLYFVAFSAGKRPDSNPSYPDFIIYPSGEETERFITELSSSINQAFGTDDNIPIVKADDIDGESINGGDFYDL